MEVCNILVDFYEKFDRIDVKVDGNILCRKGNLVIPNISDSISQNKSNSGSSSINGKNKDDDDASLKPPPKKINRKN